VVRVFAGPVPEGHDISAVFEWMADALRACAEHGERSGVLVGVQNHGDTLKTADDVLKVVKMVDSPWFGVIVDTGYFLSPDPYQDIARVTPHAVNWQVKEKVDGAAGTARTDLKKLVRIIRQGGYRGYVPIETLSVRGEPYDPRACVTRLLKELREALDQAG
jgi:sugar phosphate isomerase/epimerase